MTRDADHVQPSGYPPLVIAGAQPPIGTLRNEFDLNLLVIFEALMQERNLTRAGRRLGMSQPSVSRALARLRNTLKDELFVRVPQGMRPTPQAERMLGPVRDALQQLHLTLEADEFDASNSSRAFTIATNDYAARVVIPALVHQVAKLAPSVVLDVRSIDHLDVLDQLDAGVVDVALSTLLEGGDRFRCAGLLDDEYVVVLSRDHPAVTAPELSLERFSALPHINISSADDDARFIDDALAARGLARRTFAHVPLYSLVPILTHLQALAVVPRRVAAGLATHYPLTIRALPFSSPRITVFMIWHRQLDNYPANRWLRNALRLSHPCRAAL